MMVSNITGTNNMQQGLTGMNIKMDPTSRNIQNQIANAQKKLQELSSNTEMGVEEKMKKRQEIQQEITSLRQQLRQHQIMQRKEQQKEASTESMFESRHDEDTSKPGSKGTGLPQSSMQAMISADSQVKQAQAQGSTATKLEGKAKVLKAEIKQDSGKTGVEKKQEELAVLQQKVMDASAAQMSTLAVAGKEIEEARKAGQASSGGTCNEEDKDNGTGKTPEEGKISQENIVYTEHLQTDGISVEDNPVAYVPIDIRL